MPRGSLPGERRGGRKPGTPNKKTLLKNAVFLAAAGEFHRSPLEFMLALMRDPQAPFDLRLEMAATAAPFVHARPIRNRRAKPLDCADHLGGNGDLRFAKLEPKSVDAAGAGQLGSEGQGSSGAEGRVEAGARGRNQVGAEGGGQAEPMVGGLSPLDFLLDVLN